MAHARGALLLLAVVAMAEEEAFADLDASTIEEDVASEADPTAEPSSCTGSSTALPAAACRRWQEMLAANADKDGWRECAALRDDPCGCSFFGHRFCPSGSLTEAGAPLGLRAALGAGGWWGPYERGTAALLHNMSDVLRGRAAPVVLGLSARALHPMPGPLLSPPQLEWDTNLGRRADVLSPERILAEIESAGAKGAGADAEVGEGEGEDEGGKEPRTATAQRLTKTLVNLGAIERGVAGRSNAAYLHRLYDLGYGGPAIDTDAAALGQLHKAYPAVTAIAATVTPHNVRRLIDAAAAQNFAPSVAAAREIIAGIDGVPAEAAEDGASADGTDAAQKQEAAAVPPPEPSPAAAKAALQGAIAVAARNAPHADLLHVGLGSYDCAVTAALLDSGYRPKVIVQEVNFDIPPPIAFAVQYRGDGTADGGGGGFAWQGSGDCFYGCSLSYASKVLRAHGYTLLQLDVWDAVYVRDEYVPLFGAVPHDDYTVFALRPPLVHAEEGAGSSGLTISVCHNASAVLTNVHSSTARLGFLWRLLQQSSGGHWPFTLDVDPVPSRHDDLAAALP